MADDDDDRGFLGIPGILADLWGNTTVPTSNPMPVTGVARPASNQGEIPRLLGGPADVFQGEGYGDHFSRDVNSIGIAAAQALAGVQNSRANDQRLAEIQAMFGSQPTSGSSGGGSNNGARAAAFNAQRDAQVGAYGQQIADLESQLQNYLAEVQKIQKDGIQGINKQTQIAKSATRKERNTAEGTISQDLLGLLELLGQSQLATQAEGAATSQAIGNRSLQAAEAQNADTERFARLGGGDRLAAAALEGQDVNRQLAGIDQALAARLSQAATTDSNRRQGSARQVASGANQALAANAAQILSQITAQAAASRTDLRQSFAERKLEAQQSYAQQISAARAAQSQAAAQRYIPTATSGGGGRAALNPFQRIDQALALEEYEGIRREAAGLTGPAPQPTVNEAFVANAGGPEAFAGLIGAAIEAEDFDLADQYAKFR